MCSVLCLIAVIAVECASEMVTEVSVAVGTVGLQAIVCDRTADECRCRAVCAATCSVSGVLFINGSGTSCKNGENGEEVM